VTTNLNSIDIVMRYYRHFGTDSDESRWDHVARKSTLLLLRPLTAQQTSVCHYMMLIHFVVCQC